MTIVADSFTSSGTSCIAWIRCSLKEIAPFQNAFLLDEGMVEREAREHRAYRQQAERHQHRQRAFVRVIAAGAIVAVRVMAVVVVRVMVVMPMRIVHRVLDMLDCAQRGLPKKVRNTSRHE